jgi:peptide/nickel transport system substrate-binding protein
MIATRGPLPRRGAVRRGLRFTALAAAAIAVLAGCSSPSASDDAPTASGEPTPGGTMVVAVAADPPSLNPMTSQALATWYVSNQILETLVKYDEDFAPQPSLASSWEANDEGTVYSFTLEEDVTWHDGEPFTADDVVYTFSEAGPQYSNTYKLVMKDLESVTADGNVVTFTFSQPVGSFMSYVGDPNFSILPRHIYQGTDVMTNPANMAMVGTGPYVLDEWVQGDHLSLTRNEDYWQDGLPYLDEVVFRPVSNPATAIASLQSGDIDFIMSSIPPVNAQTLQTDDSIVLTSPSVMARTLDLWFNLREAPFDDPQVREAINIAVDRQRMVDSIAFGQTSTARGPIGSTSPYFDDELPEIERDLETAGELLDDAGFPEQSDGTRFSMTLRVSTSNDQFVRTAEVVRENLSDIGIDVEVIAAENTATLDAIFTNWDFDAAIYSMPLGPEPSLQLPAWLGEAGINHAYFSNAGGYVNAEVDALTAEAQQTVDVDERTALYAEIQQLVMADLPMVPLWEPVFITGYGTSYQNAFVAPDDRYLTFATTYLAE